MVKVKAGLVKEVVLQIRQLDKAKYSTLKEGLRVNRQIKNRLIESIEKMEEVAAKKDKLVHETNKELWEGEFKAKYDGLEDKKDVAAQAALQQEFQAAMDEAMKKTDYDKLNKEYEKMRDEVAEVKLSKDDTAILGQFFKNNFKTFTTSLDVIGDIVDGFGFDIEKLG